MTQLLAFPGLCGLLAVKPTKLSQAMHNAGFAALALPFTYCAFDVKDTKKALAATRTLGIRGLSLTIPHKEDALPCIDSISDDAKNIGAINTVINSGESLHGENTDWKGILNALSEARYSLAGKNILILGSGGAAKAAIYACKTAGTKSITVANRTESRAAVLADSFKTETIPYSSLSDLQNLKFDLMFNTTPIGSDLGGSDLGSSDLGGSDSGNSTLGGNATFPFSLENWPKRLAVFDMVTKSETALLQNAKNAGAPTIAGSRMLLYQAVEQFKLFTEKEAPLAEMEKALYKALKIDDK